MICRTCLRCWDALRSQAGLSLHEEHSDLNFSISDRAGGNISGPTPRVQMIASEPLTGLCNLKSTVRREEFNFRQEQIADRVQFLDLLDLSASPIGYKSRVIHINDVAVDIESRLGNTGHANFRCLDPLHANLGTF